ncbi:immunoglobulin superfamily member 5 isoform X2 [Scomber scombrus]|uniref:immunoglobulin superfamily member 5 isoform X2 n=1 Tax=Scomber scombrus TaxID=13677 RepID=UPI002DDBB84C|nr:immunoglobulin superfamily member 5 isoform X2 [Scomber scombrus]XP_062274488.1 immunoglobulin superfamily member 5 isoform X2 [Scomber scombrus]XP_062274489.1 immunoglobulin superfamily member 5 isoform X2 [Scomber scombrus]
MDKLTMDIFALFMFLLSCRINVGAQVKLVPETLTVLQGDEARFTCSISNTKWAAMVWTLNNEVVLTISRKYGILPSQDLNVTAQNASSSKDDSWVFILKNTDRQQEGPVACNIQDFERKTANLFVQEKGSVKVFGDNKLAFRGHSVLFECRAAGWYPQPTLRWQVTDKKVSEGEYTISSEASGISLFTVSSTLNVTAVKSSRVDCLASVSALPKPLRSSVHLTVVAEVVEEEGVDCTVPLAVTASLSAFLLLLLLCICTVLCYRQRRQAKQSQQEAVRFDPSVNVQSSVAAVTGGNVNLGYSNEGLTDAAHNELIMETRRQMDFASFNKVPDLVSFRSQSLHDSQAQVNIRRLTTV